MHGLGSKIHLKSPLAPQPVPLKLDSMPPSKGPFSANIHSIIPKLSVPIAQGMCFLKMGRGASKMHGLGSKIHLKSPLAPQPLPLKLYSTPPSKGPFSANIHPIIPKLSVPIPQGMCFLKMVGGPLRKCKRMGKISISSPHKDSGRLLTNPPKVNFPEVISPRICIWSFPTLLCV